MFKKDDATFCFVKEENINYKQSFCFILHLEVCEWISFKHSLGVFTTCTRSMRRPELLLSLKVFGLCICVVVMLGGGGVEVVVDVFAQML